MVSPLRHQLVPCQLIRDTYIQVESEKIILANYDVRCVAWALSLNRPADPLVIFTAHSLIFIADVKEKKMLGRIRVHGGVSSCHFSLPFIFLAVLTLNGTQEITCLAVHPIHPWMFCTTSKDMTTRVFDLTLDVRQEPNNPRWPPSTHASHAGPAFGLMASESEGDGIGRCYAVLVGGRSGGHQATVNAAVSVDDTDGKVHLLMNVNRHSIPLAL